MKLLLKNELIKLKRLKMVYVILIVSLLPYVINTGGALIVSGDMNADKYYYFVFNQYAILFPTLVFIFTGFFFYTEFQNRTTLNWMSYPFDNFKLIGAKMIAAFILLIGTSILNHFIHLVTLILVFRNEAEMMIPAKFFTSFLFSSLTLLIIPVAALLVFMTRNILSVVIAGVAFIFITTILLGADFSIAFPFSFIYRLSIQFYDASMGYDSMNLEVWGFIILFAYIIISLLGLYKYSRNTRMN
ncbi:ABC transporter permease [Salipaludibacillus sp. HK11]|uniref:ABC transporter permease n=1 Tax=Salipaludibacillus sp. HK11 TaxID=3394320 RepID=UPI0039FC49D2